MENATMKPRNLAFLLAEGPGQTSRAQATIPAGTGKVQAGTVLGELSATQGHFVPSPDAEVAGIEGGEVATAILGYGVDATTADVMVAIIDRGPADVKLVMLSFDETVDDDAKISAKVAQLDAVGIRAR